MKAITNNTEALLSVIEDAINNYINDEHPYGDITTDHLLDALRLLRDSYLVAFAKKEALEEFCNKYGKKN